MGFPIAGSEIFEFPRIFWRSADRALARCSSNLRSMLDDSPRAVMPGVEKYPDLFFNEKSHIYFKKHPKHSVNTV